MSNTVRVALTGYNALTETDIDNFSLYADIDNILIKRKTLGTNTITDGSPTTLTIAHNLNYIPFFLAYGDVFSTGEWKLINNRYDLFTLPAELAAVDTTNLYIYNYGGHASGNLPVVYEIFYDNMNDTTAPSITESSNVFKVARPNKDALTSTNPNDYIMHSDLNNFKIIKQGIETIDVASRTNYTFAHGATVTSPYKYLVFVKKRSDGKTILIGGTATTKSYSEGMTFLGSSMTSSNITLYFPTQSALSDVIDIKYYIFGSGSDGTVPISSQVLAVAKSGENALTATNPDDFNFHSSYATLKYATSGTYSMTVSNTTVHTIAHNLGYTPVFVAFVNDLQSLISGGYALLPYYFGRSSIPSPSRDIAAWAYADDTNIYLKAWYQPNAVGTSKTFTFYYKIFKNRLGF